MAPNYQPDLFLASAPKRPYCSDDLGGGLIIRSQQDALERRYIQHNPPCHLAFLVFDFDRPGAFLAASDAGLPEPNWVAENKDSRRGHLAYALACPVITTDAARSAPLRYAAAVEQAYRDTLRADAGYTNFITKTPGHEAWSTRWGRAEPFTLEELTEYLPHGLPTVRKRCAEASGLGRNVSLFEALRAWSYRNRFKHDDAGQWRAACLSHARSLNNFSNPLPDSEVRATAKSVAVWVWTRLGHGPAGQAFIKRQTHKSHIAASLRQSAAMDTCQKILEFRR
jgi:hypothetical protein